MFNFFKKKETDSYLELSKIVKKYSDFDMFDLSINNKEYIEKKIYEDLKSFEEFSKSLSNTNASKIDKYVSSWFTLINKTKEIELMLKHKQDLLTGFADFALDEWNNISPFYKGIARDTLEDIDTKNSKSGRDITHLF